VLPEAGKSPKWNQSFDIPIQSMRDEISFTCQDEDLMANDLVGSASLDIEELLKMGSRSKQFKLPLQFKNKVSAELILEVKFEQTLKEEWPDIIEPPMFGGRYASRNTNPYGASMDNNYP
jgi:Ca2+-dependent lipid-binding protein